MASLGRLGMLTAGGDCAGLNAVISAAVKYGTRLGYSFVGFKRGWEGVLSPMDYVPLDARAVSGIAHTGGTILHTTNRGRFAAKRGTGEGKGIPREILEEAKRNLASLGVEGLIVIGGDGSLSGARQLGEAGVRVIGIPKTIDNDLAATEQTFGFSTAVNVAVEALDRVHTTATSHDRVIFVEVMGRNAGWIALKAGLAGTADAILLPEFPFTLRGLVDYLRGRKATGGKSAVVVVAEGAKLGERVAAEGSGDSEELHYGGIAHAIMAAVERAAPGEFEMRVNIVGHIQRGGSPNARDRNLGQSYGVAAIDAYHRGESSVMVSLNNSTIVTVPLLDATSRLKMVEASSLELATAAKLGVFISDRMS